MSDYIGCGLDEGYRKFLLERAKNGVESFISISSDDLLVLLRQVDELEKRLDRLDHEADWLARVCAEQMLEGVDEQSVQWWRQKARGVAEASHD